jgi:hypothetical protein
METYLALGAKCFETKNLPSVSHCAGSACRVSSFVDQQECTCFEESNLFRFMVYDRHQKNPTMSCSHESQMTE